MTDCERIIVTTGLLLVAVAGVLSAVVRHAEPVLGAVFAFLLFGLMLLLFRWMERRRGPRP
jgi:hypothetical protein